MQEDLLLRDFQPQSRLSVLETKLEKPRFSVIDVHNHTGEDFGEWCTRPVEELLDVLDEANVRVFVDLDGGWGETIMQQRLDHFKAAAPERFCIFGGVEWSAWTEHGDQFGEWAAASLRAQVAHGAQGLKIWKDLGLRVRDQHDDLVPIDDVRLDPVWRSAADLKIPVLIHIADPVAFFDPLTPTNESWEELQAHPDWHFPSPQFPAFDTVIDQFANLIQRHPKTTFIGAHVGCYAENLAWVGALLDKCPNFYVDIAARIGMLGRQPYTARSFFIKYADRILFGTDSPASVVWYQLYYRFLETDDEYFNYHLEDPPPEGRWRIYGLNLPEQVLEKIYSRNAQRVLQLPSWE